MNPNLLLGLIIFAVGVVFAIKQYKLLFNKRTKTIQKKIEDAQEIVYATELEEKNKNLLTKTCKTKTLKKEKK